MTAAANHPPPRPPAPCAATALCAETAAPVGIKTAGAGYDSIPETSIAGRGSIIGFPKTAAALRLLDETVASRCATIARLRAAHDKGCGDAG